MLVSTKDSVKLCCFVSSQAWDLAGSLAFSSPMRARLAGRKSFSAGPFGREQLTKAYENLCLKDVEEVLKFAICPEGWVVAPRK